MQFVISRSVRTAEEQSMSYYDSEGRGTSRGMGFPPSISVAIDEGLRAHMQINLFMMLLQLFGQRRDN
jgi:hypothetical protein